MGKEVEGQGNKLTRFQISFHSVAVCVHQSSVLSATFLSLPLLTAPCALRQ